LEVLLVNLLAALNFANVFLNKKRLENKKTLKNVKNVFYIYDHRKIHATVAQTPLLRFVVDLYLDLLMSVTFSSQHVQMLRTCGFVRRSICCTTSSTTNR